MAKRKGKNGRGREREKREESKNRFYSLILTLPNTQHYYSSYSLFRGTLYAAQDGFPQEVA